MSLSSQKLLLISLYGLAALALVGAALVFAIFKDELRLVEPAVSAVEVSPLPPSFDTPFTLPTELEIVEEIEEEQGEEIQETNIADLALEEIVKDWDVLDPIDPSVAENQRPIGQSRAARQRTARIVVLTNFEKARVTVNDVHYPSYGENGENEGIRVPAGGPHHVLVNFGGNEKLYEVYVRPNETRYLMVELTGFRGTVAPKRAAPAPRPAAAQPKQDDQDGQGRVTVYSRPKGNVFIGGVDKGQATPGTIEVEAGRHDVQVRYEDGEMSEKKVVRVRQGSRIKLFFRQSN